MFILVHRNLRFSLFKTTSVHRLFPRSSSSSPAASDNSFTVSNYLIDSCGFSPEKAISASRYLKFKTPDRADSVIAFFKHQGFTKTQIAHLVQKFPRALTYHPQRNLLPKFDFLSCRGLSGSDILKLFTARPVLLGRSLKNYIEPNYNSIRDLLQSKDKTLIPRSTCSSSSADNTFRVSYLIDSCGFSPDKAISASKSLKFKTPDRPDSVIAFSKIEGSQKPRSQIWCESPLRLSLIIPKKPLPKFDFLSSTGLSDSDIIKLLTARPRFLSSSLKNRIEPNYNLLRNLLQSNDRTLIAIRRCAWVLDGYFQALMIPNMQILRDVGVPASKMLYLLTNQPSVLLVTLDKFKETVEEVVEMGFDPLKSSFMSAVHAIRSMSKSTWEKKMKTYEKWGWSKPHILVAFRSNPRCMRTSEEKIDKVMDYLVNKMGFETSIIAKNSYILTVSMEKRIIPRCLVYQYCLDNGLLNDKNYCGYGWWLACSEDIFIKRLKRYEKEAPCVLKFYQEKLDLAK